MSQPSPRLDLEAPADVRWIARRLEEAGHSAWAVGGAVRDALAGLPPGDWDLTTSARPAEVRRIFPRTVPIGIEHGTVGVIARSGRMYEVTTFRRDVETFGRKARVAFADSLEEDLERRDFTINAVAWHPLTGELRDPHGGALDLQRGLLRTVGEPEERFREDRLRVLRALRFAGRFELRVEPATWRAVRESADKLGDLSVERIREELVKTLTGQALPSTTLRLYADSGILARLYPELEACRQTPGDDEGVDAWEYQLRCVDAASATRPLVRLAALLHEVGRPAVGQGGGDAEDQARTGAAIARGLLLRLRASNAEVDGVTHLVAIHAPLPPPDAADAVVLRWVRMIGREFVNDLFRLLFACCRARQESSELRSRLLALHSRVARLLRSHPPLGVSDLAIGGEDLRALGLKPGPRFGEILRELLERVTDDPSLNERGALLAIVERDLVGDRGEG
jgi:tRNA nucleotidyltransferase (CCA-adding enzyme)